MHAIAQLLFCAWAMLPVTASWYDLSPCVFPFIYKNNSYPTCITIGSRKNQLWCATTNNYNRDRRWRRCYDTEHGGNSFGKPCTFPFVYRKRTFYTCTDERARPRMFWCATTPNYDEDRRWSYCADTAVAAMPKDDMNREITSCDTPVDSGCPKPSSRTERRGGRKKLRTIQKNDKKEDAQQRSDQEMTDEPLAPVF